MNRSLKLSLAIAMALGSANALALGLGPIEVKSKMNEPLVAEIVVTDSGDGDVAGLQAKLASAEDMARVGADSSGLSVPLDFTIAVGAKGKTVIRVTSAEAVRDPFLSFLLDVNWGKGRLLREYNVLLDPPVTAPSIVGTRAVAAPVKEPERTPAKPTPPAETRPAASAPPAATTSPAPAPAGAKPEPAKPVAAAKPEPAKKPPTDAKPEVEAAPPPAPKPTPAPAPAPAPVSGDYGPVASGETLWEIAARTRPERSVNVNQMMVALLQTNPQAFYRENVNALKRGAVLRIPNSDEARRLSASEAAAAVAAQNQAWASGAASAPVKLADSGRPESAPPSPPPPRATGAGDSRLELVPPKAGTSKSAADKPGSGGGTDTAARADLARVREQLATREQEATELRSRVTDLERIKADNEKLLNLKNSQISELQQRLGELNRQIEQQKRDLQKAQDELARKTSAATSAAPPVAEPPKPEVKPAETPVTPVTPAETPDPSKVDAGATAATTEPAPKPAEPAPGASEPKITPITEPAPVAAAEPTPSAPPATVEPLWTNPMVLGGVGLAVLAAAAALLMRRRKPAGEAEAEAEADITVAEGGASLGDQFIGGPIRARAEPVDLASDEEHTLLEHLATDPTRGEAHLALLQFYYQRRDADKFEQAANAFYAQVPDERGDTWQQVVDMGQDLLPGHSLFQDDRADFGQEPTLSDGGQDFDFDLNAGSSPKGGEVAASEPERGPVRFDFDMTPPPPSRVRAPEPEPEPEPEAFEFDMGPTAKTEQMAVPDFTADVPKVDGLDLPEPAVDFSFDTDLSGTPDLEPVTTQQIDSTALRTPAAGGAMPDFMGDDAVSTKLDLARAYLDMGDPDGAKSMLQEVLVEGNTPQKDEARRLLADLG